MRASGAGRAERSDMALSLLAVAVLLPLAILMGTRWLQKEAPADHALLALTSAALLFAAFVAARDVARRWSKGERIGLRRSHPLVALLELAIGVILGLGATGLIIDAGRLRIDNVVFLIPAVALVLAGLNGFAGLIRR